MEIINIRSEHNVLSTKVHTQHTRANSSVWEIRNAVLVVNWEYWSLHYVLISASYVQNDPAFPDRAFLKSTGYRNCFFAYQAFAMIEAC